MNETSKATIAGILDIAAGVFGLVGGVILLMLGLIGGGVMGATIPDDMKQLAVIPLALFLPLALLNLVGGGLAIAGGVAALQRRRWALAVVGAIGAIVCFFLLGIPAIIFTVLAEREFQRT